MATSTSTINFGGLASGLDTNTIVDQLMAIERQPQTRLKLRQQQIDTRKSALSDIESRLKNLQLAAQDLKSPALWLDTQSLEVNDSTKVAATRTGGAGTGGYQVQIDTLASASQHWFSYAAPAADQTITFDYGGTDPLTAPTKHFAITLAAGADIDAAAGAINSNADSPVYASVITTASGTKELAFSSKTTGVDSDFSVSGAAGVLTGETKTVAGTNSTGKVNGIAFDEQSNVVANAIPGVTLTLKGVTGATNPVTVTVGAPGPDKSAIAAKMKAFVDQYNSTVTFIKSKLDEKPVPNPTTTADQNKGVLYGDTALTALLSRMRIAMTDAYTADGTVSSSYDQMSEVGVSTGKSTGSATLNQDSVAGKLTFDQDAFMAALVANPQSVRKMLSGTSTDGGFAQSFDALLKPVVQADGTIDQTIKSQDALRRSLSDQIARMDDLLAQKQALLKSQFAAMEAAIQNSSSQGQWLSGQLAALNNNR
jgi:flagellar hook-associated protein 2